MRHTDDFMDPPLIPLRSHPVVPGALFSQPPKQSEQASGSTSSEGAPYKPFPPTSHHANPSIPRRPLPIPGQQSPSTSAKGPTHPSSQPTISDGGSAANENKQGASSENNRPVPAWSTSAAPPWSTATRPLSDIRELTEPSLVDITNRRLAAEAGNRQRSVSRKASGKSTNSVRSTRRSGPEHKRNVSRGRPSPPRSPSAVPVDRSSVYSVPSMGMPTGSSSQARRTRSMSKARGPPMDPPPPRGSGYTIPNRGHSRSPVKQIAARLDPISSDTARRAPSRTFIRSPLGNDILEFPVHRHPRVTPEFHLGASLFIGGSSIEGSLRIVVDDADRLRHKRSLELGRISIDLLGVEEMSGSKKSIFLNLATELVDSEHPPPHNMVQSLKQVSLVDPFWILTPSVSSLPFVLSLPLDVGPPPFQSKHARIRYVLCMTMLIRDTGKQYLVRRSEEISVLSVYDPEKALMSLPSPLTASDEYVRHKDAALEVIRVTAGLHRQVWVSGTSIFVDVHIANTSGKTIKKLELHLERDILCYKHAAAATMEKSASQARIFDHNERAILSKSSVRLGTNGWNGVPAHSSDTRTCDLELPRGHATVKCGKFFEVRYFINITVGTSHSKIITVQLPIVLIHMNSLDVVPNSVAQVAAAIEEKRAETSMSAHRSTHIRIPSSHSPHTRSPYVGRSRTRRPVDSHQSVQGRAFSAPRNQSLDRMRAEIADIAALGLALESSPRGFCSPARHSQGVRRVQSSLQGESQRDKEYSYSTPPTNRAGRWPEEEFGAQQIRQRLRKVASTETELSVRSHHTNRSVHLGPVPRLGAVETSTPKELKREKSDAKSSVRRMAGSALGFRELELGEKKAPDGAGGAVPRQYQFARKKKSGMLKGWHPWELKKDRDKERAKEKERERREMMDNWI